jgi:predicted TIM-barrel fold metal-dependent hydrolase
MRVDVHHHAIFPEYARLLAERGIGAQPGIALPAWSVDASLAMMDDLGIDLAVLSVGSPGFHFGDRPFTRQLCELTNDALAGVVGERPDRFAAFAAVPLPSVEDSLAELDRVLARPGFAGVGLLTNYSEKYLGDPAFDPLLAYLDARGSVVHVHPTLPPYYPRHEIDLRPSLLEYVFDTTRALVHIILQGLPARFPNIRWIFSHCGGTAPYLAGRLAIAEGLPELSKVGPAGILGAMRGFHYDTALSTTPYSLGALRELSGSDALLIGSDFPFVDEATVRACLAQARELLGDDAFETVATTNAAKLFAPRTG